MSISSLSESCGESDVKFKVEHMKRFILKRSPGNTRAFDHLMLKVLGELVNKE